MSAQAVRFHLFNSVHCNNHGIVPVGRQSTMTNGNIYRNVSVHGHQVHLGNTYISKQDDVLQSPAAAVEYAYTTLDLADSALQAFLELGTVAHQVDIGVERSSISSAASLEGLKTASCTFRERVATWALSSYRPKAVGMEKKLEKKLEETRDQVHQRMQAMVATMTTILDIYYETKKVDESNGARADTGVEVRDRIAKDLSTQLGGLASALGLFTRYSQSQPASLNHIDRSS